MRRRLARQLHRWADWIDYDTAMRIASLTFTFERGQGAVIRSDGRGCPIWFRPDDYDRAHAEANQGIQTPVWLRIDEAALALGVPKPTIYRWTQQGAPHRRTRLGILVDPDAITAWKRRRVISRRLRHAQHRPLPNELRE